MKLKTENYWEIRQLFDTVVRVWGAGGKVDLHLTSSDGTINAKLDLQLGKPGEPRPGAPEVRGEVPGPHHVPQHQRQPTVRRPRHRGPAARARDAARRAEWIKQREERQQRMTAAAGQSDTASVTTVESTATVTSESTCANRDTATMFTKLLVTHLSSSTPREEEEEWSSEPMAGDKAMGV